MSRFLPLAHAVATDLTVAVGGPMKGKPDISAGAVRLLLAILAREAAVVDDHDLDEDRYRLARQAEYASTGKVSYDPLRLSPAQVRADVGGLTTAGLRADLGRIRAMAVTVGGEHPGPTGSPVSGQLDTLAGVPVTGKEPAVAQVLIERTLLAAAGGADAGREGTQDVVWLDFQAMEDFTSRYAPLAYARVRAWLDVPERAPRAWKLHRTAAGALAFDIPVAEVRRAVGVDGYPMPSDLGARVLDPVASDLAKAGIGLSWQWVRNRRGDILALRLRIVEDEALRREAQAAARTLKLARRETRLANKKPRRERQPRRAPRPPRPDPMPTAEEMQAPGLRGLDARYRAARVAARARWVEEQGWPEKRRARNEARRRKPKPAPQE